MYFSDSAYTHLLHGSAVVIVVVLPVSAGTQARSVCGAPSQQPEGEQAFSKSR
jgi:hypothetical protein